MIILIVIWVVGAENQNNLQKSAGYAVSVKQR